MRTRHAVIGVEDSQRKHAAGECLVLPRTADDGPHVMTVAGIGHGDDGHRGRVRDGRTKMAIAA
jgi:hypothetical protein